MLKIEPKTYFIFCLLAFSVRSSGLMAAPQVNMTIYNAGGQMSGNPNGFAFVRDQKTVELKSGLNSVTFRDLPRGIDPDSIILNPLNPKGTLKILEQEYRLNPDGFPGLLDRAIGKNIRIEQVHGSEIETYSGKLLSANGGLTIQNNEGKWLTLTQYSNVFFEEDKEEALFKPNLNVSIENNKAETLDVLFNYQTSGLGWDAHYQAIYQESPNNKGELALNAWATLHNQSGVGYDNAAVKLMAGEVNLANKNAGPQPMLKMAAAVESTSSVSEKPIFEYHLYTLARPVTLPNNSNKQIELFPSVKKIPVEKQYVYKSTVIPFYGVPNYNRDQGEYNKNIQANLKFVNNKQSGLGIPLPAGKIRVYNRNSTDGSLEFIGEDSIEHTPAESDVILNLGSAFDLTVQKKQMSFNYDENRRIMNESFQLILKNQKETDVSVVVKESLSRTLNWKVADNNFPYEKKDSQTVEFIVPIKKKDQTVLTYSVHYTW